MNNVLELFSAWLGAAAFIIAGILAAIAFFDKLRAGRRQEIYDTDQKTITSLENRIATLERDLKHAMGEIDTWKVLATELQAENKILKDAVAGRDAETKRQTNLLESLVDHHKRNEKSLQKIIATIEKQTRELSTNGNGDAH